MLHDREVVQRIKEAMNEFDTVFPISGHPAMRADAGFVELPARLGF